MFTKKLSALIALTICTIAVTAFAAAKHQVERPLFVKATAVWTINPDGTATCYQEGEATHLGHITVQGEAVWDLAHFLILSGSGDVLAANKDKLFWQSGPNNSIIITGGTGKFVGATGGFDSTLVGSPAIDVNEDGTVTVIVEYTGVGTLKY